VVTSCICYSVGWLRRLMTIRPNPKMKVRQTMADAGGSPEPVAIPPQADFPVGWAHSDEQKIPWQHDRMHYPEAMPTLEGEFWTLFMNGIHLAMEHFKMPLQAASKPINNWQYLGIFPCVPPE
jgi:hypothetical protein